MINRIIVDYKPEHLEQIIDNLRGFERRQLEKVRTDITLWNDMIISDTPSPKTFLSDEKPIVIGGISSLWSGVGEGWIIGSQEFKKHMFYICRNARKYINKHINLMKLTRLQAVVIANNQDVYNFATKFLGFTYEGYLHKYGMDGSDQLMLAKWGK